MPFLLISTLLFLSLSSLLEGGYGRDGIYHNQLPPWRDNQAVFYARRGLDTGVHQTYDYGQESLYQTELKRTVEERPWKHHAYSENYITPNPYYGAYGGLIRNRDDIINPWERGYYSGTYSNPNSYYGNYSGSDINGNGTVEPWERNSYQGNYFGPNRYHGFYQGRDINRNSAVERSERNSYQGYYIDPDKYYYDAYNYPN